MKKKKVSQKENEWKGVLQEEIVNVKNLDSTKITLDLDKKELVFTNINNQESKQVIDVSMLYNSSTYIQESESNVTPGNYNPTTTSGSDYDIDKENINIGVNKNWLVKEKRVKFYNTSLSYWQFIPAVAVDLIFKGIDISWLCFGVSISFKKN
jgi:hypothetical protein